MINVLSLYRHKSREEADARKSKVDRHSGVDGATLLQRSNRVPPEQSSCAEIHKTSLQSKGLVTDYEK